MLSQEERNDLRKRVLRGESLSVEEAKAVFETLRQGQGAVVLTEEKPKKSSRKKEALSDAQLDSDLAGLGF